MWTATTAGISGEMIRDMMLVSVERRFGGCATTHCVEFLSDNGSRYTAHETIEIALSLGLMPCFTPVRRPESNGMAESFVWEQLHHGLHELAAATLSCVGEGPAARCAIMRG